MFIPFILTYGREAKFPADIWLENKITVKRKITDEYVKQLVDQMIEIQEIAAHYFEQAKARQAQYYNQNPNMINPDYKIGDKVWVYIPVIEKEISKTNL